MTIRSFFFGTTLCVSNSGLDRNRAALQLIRPNEVSHLVNVVPAASLPRGHSSAQAVTNQMSLMFRDNRLRYLPDPSNDLWRSPRATLVNGGGDCEDLAIIAVSMLRPTHPVTALAVGTMWSAKTGSWIGHAWVEGHDELGGFLLESTEPELHRVNGLRPWMYRPDYFVGYTSVPIAA